MVKPEEIRFSTINYEKIRQKYGQRVYDLLMEFPEHPELVPRDVAGLAGLSPQHVRKIIHSIHGTCLQPRLALRCRMINTKRFGVLLQRVMERFPSEKVGRMIFKSLVNGRTFAVRRLRHIERGRYTYLACSLRTPVDYIVGAYEDRYFVFPLLKKANGVMYFRIPFVYRFENAFHFLITQPGKGNYENTSDSDGRRRQGANSTSL